MTLLQVTSLARQTCNQLGHPFFKLLKAKRRGGTWVVEVDVGAISVVVVRLTIDDETSTVTDYNYLGTKKRVK